MQGLVRAVESGLVAACLVHLRVPRGPPHSCRAPPRRRLMQHDDDDDSCQTTPRSRQAAVASPTPPPPPHCALTTGRRAPCRTARPPPRRPWGRRPPPQMTAAACAPAHAHAHNGGGARSAPTIKGGREELAASPVHCTAARRFDPGCRFGGPGAGGSWLHAPPAEASARPTAPLPPSLPPLTSASRPGSALVLEPLLHRAHSPPHRPPARSPRRPGRAARRAQSTRTRGCAARWRPRCS